MTINDVIERVCSEAGFCNRPNCGHCNPEIYPLVRRAVREALLLAAEQIRCDVRITHGTRYLADDLVRTLAATLDKGEKP